MSTVDAFTNAELVAAARKSLSDPAWNRLVGAAESETTARRNRMALDSIALRPREILEEELRVSLALLGATSIDALSGSHLFRDVPPVEFPTETSAFFSRSTIGP